MAAQDIVVAINSVLIELLMGGKMSIDYADGDSVDLEANADTALAAPIASEAKPGVLSLDASKVRDMLDQSEETEDDSDESYGADLDVSKGC